MIWKICIAPGGGVYVKKNLLESEKKVLELHLYLSLTQNKEEIKLYYSLIYRLTDVYKYKI